MIFAKSFLFVLPLITVSSTATVEVDLDGGPVIGVQDREFDVFRGIPFAESPTGSGRWTPPVPKRPWAPAVLDATKFGYTCPQTGDFGGLPLNMSEDCLHVNVWTPSSNKSAPLSPVMVFIYGGGWTQGYADFPLYWGDFYANSTGTVLVTFNYRLGALGFLYTEELGGNFALMDQRLALLWVQQNIRAFRGDPSRVTIFGQSAGAISVAYHLTSPLSAGLFSAAIMESNPFALTFRTVEQSTAYARLFAGLLGCSVGDVGCLQSRSVDDILAAQGETFWVPFPMSPRDELPWQPVLDGRQVLGQPLQLIANGSFTKVPVILGTVRNETLSFIYGALSKPMTAVEYLAAVAAWWQADAAAVLELYPPDEHDCRPIFSQLTTDLFMQCPTRFAAASLSNASVSVYLYNFLYTPIMDPMNNSSYCREQSCHGADLAYVFHSADFDPGYTFESAAESALSWSMLRSWGRFASETSPDDSWPRFDVASRHSRGFTNGSVVVLDDFNGRRCDLWDRLGWDRVRTAALPTTIFDLELLQRDYHYGL